MAFRTDLLPYLEIDLGTFQDFDKGRQVAQTIPLKWRVSRGDILFWSYAQFEGTLRVISIDYNNKAVVEKIN